MTPHSTREKSHEPRIHSLTPAARRPGGRGGGFRPLRGQPRCRSHRTGHHAHRCPARSLAGRPSGPRSLTGLQRSRRAGPARPARRCRRHPTAGRLPGRLPGPPGPACRLQRRRLRNAGAAHRRSPARLRCGGSAHAGRINPQPAPGRLAPAGGHRPLRPVQGSALSCSPAAPDRTAWRAAAGRPPPGLRRLLLRHRAA